MDKPRSPSATLPLFEQNAEELTTRLEADGRPRALELAREARELSSVFHAWRGERPDDKARVDTITRLFDLTRRAMDLLADKKSR